MANKLVSILICLIGIAGLFIFKDKDALFMQIMSILMIMLPMFLLIMTFDKEWGNPFEYFKNVKQNNLRAQNLKVRGTLREKAFIRVHNTIKNGKIFVSQEEDGIYIRLAGDENQGEAFAEKKVKVYDYEK